MWKFLDDQIQWHDKSDMVMDSNRSRAKLTTMDQTFQAFYSVEFSKLRDALKTQFENHPVLCAYPDLDKIASHIVARGKDFYTTIVSAPEIALYLIDSNDWQECNL